jgi:hypothetical protein
MNASAIPLCLASAASPVTGKSNELVAPVSQELPSVSTRTALAPSFEEPPSTVEKISADPEGLRRVRNASLPSGVVSNTPGVVGKSSDPAPPATYALPDASTVSPLAESNPLPPRNVE